MPLNFKEHVHDLSRLCDAAKLVRCGSVLKTVSDEK